MGTRLACAVHPPGCGEFEDSMMMVIILEVKALMMNVINV
jgi:hypothetical protein